MHIGILIVSISLCLVRTEYRARLGKAGMTSCTGPSCITGSFDRNLARLNFLAVVARVHVVSQSNLVSRAVSPSVTHADLQLLMLCRQSQPCRATPCFCLVPAFFFHFSFSLSRLPFLSSFCLIFLLSVLRSRCAPLYCVERRGIRISIKLQSNAVQGRMRPRAGVNLWPDKGFVASSSS